MFWGVKSKAVDGTTFREWFFLFGRSDKKEMRALFSLIYRHICEETTFEFFEVAWLEWKESKEYVMAFPPPLFFGPCWFFFFFFFFFLHVFEPFTRMISVGFRAPPLYSHILKESVLNSIPLSSYLLALCLTWLRVLVAVFQLLLVCFGSLF